MVNNYFARNGFTSLNGKCGTNCFDGVFVKGDKVYVVETKPLNADGSIKLNGPSPRQNETTLDTQMTKVWIESRAKELVNSGKPDLEATGKKILQLIDSNNLVKVVAGADSKGVTFVRLK